MFHKPKETRVRGCLRLNSAAIGHRLGFYVDNVKLIIVISSEARNPTNAVCFKKIPPFDRNDIQYEVNFVKLQAMNKKQKAGKSSGLLRFTNDVLFRLRAV
jgi:hypothetical protein